MNFIVTQVWRLSNWRKVLTVAGGVAELLNTVKQPRASHTCPRCECE